MSIETCLFLKPKLDTQDFQGLGQQSADQSNVFETAFKLAELSPIVETVDENFENLIEQVWTAELVIFDVNAQSGNGALPLSPHLTYLMGLRHSIGNRTLLVARNNTPLPPALNQARILFYDSNAPQGFFKRLQETVQKLRARGETTALELPDNPIQRFLQTVRARQDQQTRDELQREIERRDEELMRLKQQNDQRNAPPRPIAFRPVAKRP